MAEPRKPVTRRWEQLPLTVESCKSHEGSSGAFARRAALYASIWSAIFVGMSLYVGCQKPPPVQKSAAVQQAKQSASIQAAAVEWLIRQQHADHLWHSETYGNLKGGGAITALVLYAFAHVDPELAEPHRDRLQAACDTLAREIPRHGCIASPDGKDYPTYASAMFLLATHKLRLKLSYENQNALTQFLIDAQIDDAEGFEPNDVDFGGWDMEGVPNVRRQTTGTNISVGAIVAEALQQVGWGIVDPQPTLNRFRVWLERCHNFDSDGGFFFHPQRGHDGNKAGWELNDQVPDRNKPCSYGSATADGIRGMLACGQFLGNSENRDRLRAALRWISDHRDIERVPGLKDRGEGSWSEGLKFYYWQSLAAVLPSLPVEARMNMARHIRETLATCQSPDGFWQNDNGRMREDDPLIATSFALIALAGSER